MSEQLTINNIEIRIRRSERRKTIGLTVERDGSVVAAVPPSLPLSELDRLLRGRELWLHSALSRRDALPPAPPAKEYVSGEGFLYLGRAYRLRVLGAHSAGEQAPEMRFFRSRFELRSDCAPRGRECFVRWYSTRAEQWLAERMPRLEGRVGVEVQLVPDREQSACFERFWP